MRVASLINVIYQFYKFKMLVQKKTIILCLMSSTSRAHLPFNLGHHFKRKKVQWKMLQEPFLHGKSYSFFESKASKKKTNTET